jgi:hypothetical protein
MGGRVGCRPTAGLMPRTPIRPELAALVLSAFVVVVIVAGAVVLELAGVEMTTYAAIVAGPVVSGLVGLLLSKRVAVLQTLGSQNRAAIGRVEQQTNGLTTRRFNSLDDQLGSAAVDRASNEGRAATNDQAARDDRAVVDLPPS